MSEAASERILELLSSAPGAVDELADIWGMSPEAVVEWLRSAPELPTELVCDAADALRVPSAYLAGVTDSAGFSVALRAGAIDTARAPVEMLDLAGTLLQHVKLLDSWQGAPSRLLDGFDAVRTGYLWRDGQRTAERVRDVLGLGTAPIVDLTGLVERLGYPVTHVAVAGGPCGMTARDDHDGRTDRVIIVNTHGDEWTRQRFTLAHELGHCVFDDAGQLIVDDLAESDRAEEVRANRFARSLLLPEAALRDRFDAARSQSSGAESLVAHLMVEFGVSREMTLKALVDDSLVSAQHPALPGIRSRAVSALMANAGLEQRWEQLSAGSDHERPSPSLSTRARDALARGWVHPRIVAEIEMRDVDEIISTLPAPWRELA